MMLHVVRLGNGEPEIFRSIQGEGVNSGMSAAFLRLAFCNLRCTWCDTKYSWDWQQYDQKSEVVTLPLKEIVKHIRALGIKHLVVTGGEPLVQQTELTNLLVPLKTEGYYIEIETNGTIPPTNGLLSLADQWNVSPKLENSGNPLAIREVLEAYSVFTSLSTSYFKFVIIHESDLNEVHAITNRYRIAPSRIILMPEGTEREKILARGRWLADACRDRGYRFCTRLHILLWDNTRGM